MGKIEFSNLQLARWYVAFLSLCLDGSVNEKNNYQTLCKEQIKKI